MAAPTKKPKNNRLGSAPQATPLNTVGNNTSKPSNSELVPLNFKVDAEFKRDIKSFAASHDMSMVDVIKMAFEEYKKTKGSN
ncbi:hypothetical protein TUM4438_44220 [Shewanella sairae]|uniref:ParG n=1 Tax=Shewanella sairae TaxID=190310 RepID=A0ABQ4PRG0_9GAMM|nr:hypothetical protein [Shewanella sairae]MCL1132487.1 hypothetical protein [Shewanella sairae]GIU52182.1 hypothetical protein TUM4438_44220 [Shewanella sairae]